MSAFEVLGEKGMQDELRWLYETPEAHIALDTETTGFRVGGDSYAIGVSLAAITPSHACSIYVPLRHRGGVNVGTDTHAMLRYVLSEQERQLTFANVQFDILALESVGIPTEHQDFRDICTIAHLLNENAPSNKKLDTLAQHYVGAEARKIDDPFIKKEMASGWPTATYEQVWPYAVTDAELTWRVDNVLLEHPEYAQLPVGLWEHKQDLIRVLLTMRRRGVKIDTDLVGRLVAKSDEQEMDAKIAMGLKPKDAVGFLFLNRVLHEELKIPVLHRTPTGRPKFDKTAMADYDELIEMNDSPVGKELRKFRGWSKASSAAYKPYLKLMDSDGRLRCSYKLHGTVTGRLSCAEPNLQQIPKSSDKPWNGRVKECFIAEEGYTLINADFSQLELRLATAYAQEPELVQVFDEGRDIFTEMSEQLGMTRQDTKTLVYSMQYGAGLNRLKTVFKVSDVQAEAIRSNYYRTFPKFRQLSEQASRVAEQDMVTKLWSGRKRRYRFKSETFKAMNSLIQGGAADIVERIMVRCFERLDSDDCRMLLQVHDSITWEIRTELVGLMVPQIKAVMEDVDAVLGFEAGVKFAVEVEPWSAVEARKLEALSA